jgi:hypothetical protein
MKTRTGLRDTLLRCAELERQVELKAGALHRVAKEAEVPRLLQDLMSYCHEFEIRVKDDLRETLPFCPSLFRIADKHRLERVIAVGTCATRCPSFTFVGASDTTGYFSGTRQG